MEKFKPGSLNSILLVLAVCASSSMLGAVLGGRLVTANGRQPVPVRQSDEKVIEVKRFPNEPYSIRHMSVRKTAITRNQKFSAKALAEAGGGRAEDWLENLALTVKNESDRRITYILIELDFPETAVNAPLMVYSKRVGIDPKLLSLPEQQRGSPFSLDAGDAVTITLSANDLEGVKEFLATRNLQLADLNKVVVRVSSVIFDDGTKWAQGYRYKPNPNTRSGYEQISQ